MYVYLIENTESGTVYVGITRNSIEQRFTNHKSAARAGKRYSALYDAMRSYGFDKFSIRLLKVCVDETDLLESEKFYVNYYRELHGKTYNILDGGQTYFPIVDKEAWRRKLKKARTGKKPALGMKHSDKNKELFKKVSKDYWSSQDTYNADEVTALPFSEAHRKYGISKTHYYRLKRLNNVPNTGYKRKYNYEEVVKLSAKEASELFGMDETYYYRIKKNVQ